MKMKEKRKRRRRRRRKDKKKKKKNKNKQLINKYKLSKNIWRTFTAAVKHSKLYKWNSVIRVWLGVVVVFWGGGGGGMQP